MTRTARIHQTGRRLPALLLAAAGLGLLPGCGAEERLSREEFGNRLQDIVRPEGARYERLGRRVMRIAPDQALPDDVKQGMLDLAAGNRRAADALDGLNPPQEAEDAVGSLVEALRERADAFTRAARDGRTTLRKLEADGSITRAGEEIDSAFEHLRRAGFPKE